MLISAAILLLSANSFISADAQQAEIVVNPPNRTVATVPSKERPVSNPSSKSSGSKQFVEKVSLPMLAKEAISIHFHESKYHSLNELLAATPVCTDYRQPVGLFVTLSRGGKTRACWGSINPKGWNQVEATIRTTEEALTKEYRFPRVREDEWPKLKAQVTIIRGLEALSNIYEQNALKYGLMVRSGGKGAVLLPGEASDAHYQLVLTKLKAGIPVEQPCQIYRIRADVYK
jgi:AMMECR1 domain-containing protein